LQSRGGKACGRITEYETLTTLANKLASPVQWLGQMEIHGCAPSVENLTEEPMSAMGRKRIFDLPCPNLTARSALVFVERFMWSS
jgi:hypothetical protein